MKHWNALAGAILLAYGATAAAQSAEAVRLLGLARLEIGPVALSGLPNDAIPKAGYHAPRTNAQTHNAPASGLRGSTASIPAPRGQSVAGAGAGVLRFEGLNSSDQAAAGTGVYAGSQFILEPPDQGLCAGNGFVMEAINNALAVYDTRGNRVAGPTALSQFFKLLPEFNPNTGVSGQFISDPKCHYDRQTHRWFVTELEIDTDPATGNLANHSSTLVAVSKTANPFGDYFLYAFDTTDDGTDATPSHPSCPCLGDQPLIGADSFGFYVSTNEFPIAPIAGFNGTQLYAMSKAALVAGTLGTVQHIDVGETIPTPPADAANGALWASLQPAFAESGNEDEDGNGSGTEYLLSGLQFGPAPFDNRIATWALTNTASLNSKSPKLHLLHTVIRSESYGMSDAFGASQKAGNTPLRDVLAEGDSLNLLNANDDRMNQVVFADGVLWSGVNTNVSIGGQTRQGIAWFAVVPLSGSGSLKAFVVDQGYVAVKGEDVLFPSIAIDGNGGPVMSFTLSGPDYYPSAAYSRPGGFPGVVHVIGAGVGPDDGFTGYAAFGGNGIARWGDYSAAVADEWGNVWVATEYIGQTCDDAQFAGDQTCGFTRTPFSNWGTFIGMIPGGNEQ